MVGRHSLGMFHPISLVQITWNVINREALLLTPGTFRKFKNKGKEILSPYLSTIREKKKKMLFDVRLRNFYHSFISFAFLNFHVGAMESTELNESCQMYLKSLSHL